MEERLLVTVHITDKLYDIIDVVLSLYALVDVIDSSHHMVFPHCLLYDLILFDAVYKPVVDTERHTILICQMCQYCELLRCGRILRYYPYGFIIITADIVVSIEFDCSRYYAVEVALDTHFFLLLGSQLLSSFLHSYQPP